MKRVISRFMQRAFLILILAIAMANSANAYTDPTMSSALRGSQGQIIVGRADTTIDNKFYNLTGFIDTTYSLKNIVSLSIDPLSPLFIQSDFTTNIRIEIKTTNAENQTNTIEKILTVNYKKAAGIKYDATQYYNFENATKVEVRILEITSDVAWNTTQVLILKNELTANRDYAFNCSTAITGLAFENLIIPQTDLDKPDEIRVSWADPNNGQTDYDLEWAWVDIQALSLFPQDGSGNYIQQNIFENNATRVTVTDREYKVPLLYDGDGKLFVRVRPVQLKNDGTLVEGMWSAQSASATFAFTGHATQLNWQASSSYAEEGKHKSVVQYFDGTLRNRQTVTKDNTTKTTVVAETFYDYQGRPVIQVLPSPTLSNIIQYAKNFNRSITTDGYPKTLYDKLLPEQAICSKITPALSTASGAAQYYSPNNPLLAGSNTSGINNFIPNAEGPTTGEAYPFTETRYDPDGSGRVASQGGVGITHQLGSNHETKYFYTGADQKTELDPLFGTDAGNASHYFKNIVKDANGQYSISYADMHGRTVATALAGNNPANLDPIPSYTNARKDVTRDLLPPGTNQIIGNTIKSSQPLMAMQQGDFHFQYALTPDNFILENCDTTSICYDCIYSLKITLSSDCNTNAPIIIAEKKNFTLGDYLKDTYLNNCNEQNQSPNFIVDTHLQLNEGAYTVTKELTLSTDALNYYRDSVFLPANTCKTLKSFVEEEYNLLQANANCKVTCQSCLDSLGSDYNAYRKIMLRKLNVLYNLQGLPLTTNSLTEDEVLALEPQFVKAYAEAKENCEIMCNPNGNYGADYIKSIRDLMLYDMVPGVGQYARFDKLAVPSSGPSSPAQPAINYTNIKYNIFKENDPALIYNGPTILIDNVPTNDDAFDVPGSDWKNALWYNPTTTFLESANPYKDIFDQPDLVNAKIESTELPLYTKEEFEVQFNKKAWPESLLPHHPEYCKLRTLESAGMKSAFAFETRLLGIKNWQDAAGAFAIGPDGTPFDVVRYDPFFTNVFTSSLSSMHTSVEVDYKTEPANARPIWSMWQMAQGIAFCRNLPNSYTNAQMQNCISTRLPVPTNTTNQNGSNGCPDWDYAWTIFRSLYLTERKKHIDKYLEQQCSLFLNPTEDLFKNGTYQLRFQNVVTGNYNTGDATLNAALAELSAGIVTGNGAATLLGNQADATCRSYAGSWLDAIKKCPTIKASLLANPGDEIAIIDNLVGVCKKGYDATHPLGSSSISPNTTPYNGYSNFPEVIKAYLLAHGVNQPWSALCNPYLITVPAPYERTPALTNQLVITKPDECQCERLQTLKNEHLGSIYAGNTFSFFLEKSYGTKIRQGTLDTLITLCRDGNIAGCNFLTTPIAIPPILQCNGPIKTCIDCNEYTTIRNQYYTEFGATIAMPILSPQTAAEFDKNKAFADYFNTKTGFNKSWTEYAVFANGCTGEIVVGKANNENNLTEAARVPQSSECTNLETIYQAYYNTYVNPTSRIIDLDIRTFYGNKTPCVGDVGVFDINGDLIGNTTLDCNNNQNFANVWNSSSINSVIGTLTPITGTSKVRLTLKAGQTAPCNGIIGMRYYTYINPNLVLDGIMTGPGCYIDFNDGVKTKVDISLTNAITGIYKIPPTLTIKTVSYYVTHTFQSTRDSSNWTVKIYHSDTLGTIGFDTNLLYGTTPLLTNINSLKGYLPEQTKNLIFHSTQDSSLNTFSKIQNKNSFKGIETLNFYGHANGGTPLYGYNFGLLDSFPTLKAIAATYTYKSIGNETNYLLLKDLIGNPLNVPKVKSISLGAKSYTDDAIINFPELTSITIHKIANINQGLLAYQVDTILNQIARYTLTNNGDAILSDGNEPRTSASDNAVNMLIARGWNVRTAGTVPLPTNPANLKVEDLSEYRTPALSQFSEYYSTATNNPNSTIQQIQSTYTTTCGYIPNFCSALVNPNNCDSLQNVLKDFLNQPSQTGIVTIICGPVGNAFVTYYNTRFGTNFTYAQLKDKYFQCGIIFGDCAFNNCDTLKNTLNDYVNNNYSSKWKLGGNYDGGSVSNNDESPPQILPPVVIEQCIGAGIFGGYPAQVNSYPPGEAYCYIPTLSFSLLKDSMCINTGAGLSIEFRSRIKPDLPVITNKTSLRYKFQFDEGLEFQSNWVNDPCIAILNDSLGLNCYTDFVGTGYGPVILIPSPIATQNGLKEWHTSKYTFGNNKVSYYLDNALVFETPATINPTRVKSLLFKQPYGTPEQIDYVRILDANGMVKWQEDFNNVTVPPIPYASSCTKITCGPVGNAFVLYYNTRHGTNYTYQQIVDIYFKCGIILGPCTTQSGPLLCGLSDPIALEDSLQFPSPCDGLDSVAATIGEIRYNIYLDSLRNAFDTAYYNKCMKAGALEKFTVKYSNAEHHYTLYYYDQAGNLVRTVPPESVIRNDNPSFLLDVATKRAAVMAGGLEFNNRRVPLHAQDGPAQGAALATNYRYNTLNQVIAQKTPDAGESKFYYDRLGRLVLSQNAKQAVVDRLSYTEYDFLGRISQVGEIDKGSLPDTREQTVLADWLTVQRLTKKQITRTVYDVSYFNGEVPATLSGVLVQSNLRNRVSYTQVFDEEPAGENDLNYAATHRAATYYSYDIHGNVDTLMQDYGAMGRSYITEPMAWAGNRFKKIAYSYDLISGKVNKVSYQPGYADEFYHRYTYDAENRITMAETSHDDILWERDARYTYYKHGPLARTVIGEEEVQGVDYAYTLQGWLKGVNTTGLQGGDGTIGQGEDCGPASAVDNLFIYNREPALPGTYKARTSINFMPDGFESFMPDNFVASIDPTLAACATNGNAGDIIMPTGNLGQFDMGQDGRTNATNQPVTTNNSAIYGNNTRTLDAYGYSLNYFRDDYKKISNAAQAPNPFAQITNGIGLGSNDPLHPTVAKDLFNGNISAMAVSIPQLGKGMVYGYSYDQLNRITSMTAFSGLTSSNSFTPVALDKYRENISYDANGNILTYKRNGDKNNNTQGYVMDNLTYNYNKDANGKLQNNKLRQVAEAIGVDEAAYIEDIDNQTDADNYAYDEIGNLIKDTKEGITEIEWTVYGKIKRIEREKLVDGFIQNTTIEYTYDASGNRIGKLVNTHQGYASMTYTFYVRDASGNVMSVYEAISQPRRYSLMQKEIHLYGSSRLGILNVNRDVRNLQPALHNETTSIFEQGNKFFELSNHLGNVLVTISDKKLAVDSDGNGVVDYYNADVVTANDYYPFGMQMPGRKYSQPNSSYRYGFNGQENSDEIFEGSTTAEYWEYDSRLGRRWNIDPVSKAFLSDYCTFGNNPILYLDPSGADFYKDKKGKIMWIEKHDKIGSTAMINGKKFTNIGTSITVRTNSEIRLPTDIEVGDRVAGSKLINYLTITGNYDKKGKFLGFSSDFQRKTGVTDLGFVQLKGTDGVKGKSNSYEPVPNDSRQSGTSATISQHTEVNPLEAPGLKLITGGQLVDVNVRMTVGISFESEFFINIEHGTYPSVRIDIQTQGQPYKAVYDYFQSSFTMSHVKDAMTIFATQKKSNSVHNFQRVFNEYNRKKVNQPFVLFMGFNDGNDR